MCTVTFIPAGEKVLITSNRDEKHRRSAAQAPDIYHQGGAKLLYPKDADAGGSWFAVHENGNAVVFLNGGWQKHIPDPPYRKSRGLILLDLAAEAMPVDAFHELELDNIEPFTAVILQEKLLYECRWDGSQKYTAEKNNLVPHIWSSVTLYDEATISRRKQWFDRWLLENPEPSQDDILLFHQFSGDGDRHNDLLMNRDDLVFTVSITSAVFMGERALMKYIDLKQQRSHWRELALHKAIPAR